MALIEVMCVCWNDLKSASVTKPTERESFSLQLSPRPVTLVNKGQVKNETRPFRKIVLSVYDWLGKIFSLVMITSVHAYLTVKKHSNYCCYSHFF